ncbi:MAG: hypothetical protein NT062_26930 [Proteobacteria bacterium]|nr:hypothetical protein [Pseudomonadota bacterium]
MTAMSITSITSITITFLRGALGVTLLGLCQCGTDGFFEVISPGSGTSCGKSTSDPVGTLAIGEGVVDMTTGETTFQLLDEGAPATLVHGFQGADMLVLAHRLTGAGGQTCIAQRTDIMNDAGDRLAYTALSQAFTVQPDGASLGEWMYLPGAYVPGPVTIEVSLGGQHLTRHVQVVLP